MLISRRFSPPYQRGLNRRRPFGARSSPAPVRQEKMGIIPVLPLSVHDLLAYYQLAKQECSFLISHLESSLELLEVRMKPSALVSAQFNTLEAYFSSFLDHLKWRLVPPSIDEDSSLAKSETVQKIIKLEYKPSGISHPIDEAEINPMLDCLRGLEELLDDLISEFGAAMLRSIFLCHSSVDKPKVRQLANDLLLAGATVWFDEAEIKIGDSIIRKIEEGINKCDYLGVVLSKKAVASVWVRREVEMALTQEIIKDNVKVLPILLENCDIPGFLLGKLYADLRKDGNYQQELEKIISRLKT